MDRRVFLWQQKTDTKNGIEGPVRSALPKIKRNKATRLDVTVREKQNIWQWWNIGEPE